MIRWLLLATLVALAPTGAAALEPYETVLSSPHNFFARTEFPIGSRVCYGCHAEGPGRVGPGATSPRADEAQAPEVAVPPALSAPLDAEPPPAPPLWQRGAPAYTVSLATGGSSTACLGCHDGVLGQEVHQMGDPDAQKFDHPYNVVYPRRANGKFIPERPTVNQYRYWSIPDLRNGDLVLPTGPTSRLLAVPAVSADDASPGVQVVRTSEGRVQCDSCHDPHDNGSAPFLRAPAQDLCFICHDR
ncbi:MAG: cytochrome c3 family protein [Nitrospirota bacterium]